MNSLELAIVKTLIYADLFDHALTDDQLALHLVEFKLKNLNELTQFETQKIKKKGGYYYLSGRDNLVELEPSQLKITTQKIHHTQQYRWVFALIPWIKMVGITGSVGGGTPKPNDDIDLIIITQPNRLWLTRLFLNLFLNMLGKRRKPYHHPNQVNNKFCLNMWLSQDSLQESHHDIYTANELANIKPLLNRDNTYKAYIAANPWLAKLLPNFYASLNLNTFNTSAKQSNSNILKILDDLAQKLQQKIMKKPSRETIQARRLAFHPHDYRAEILKRYQQRLIELKALP